MKIINLFLFCSFFIGFSNPVDNKITISNQATQCTVTVSVTHSSCTINGISSEDGTIKVEASATSGKTAIKWSSNTNSNLNQDKWEQTNLKPGEYDIEVFHNDKSVYHQKHIINAPDSFDISIEKTDNRCFGDKTGSISIDATGGTPPYQYSIDEGENFNNNPIFEKLPAGNYPVMVKDANNCIVSATIRIGQGRYFSISHPESIEIEACTSQKEINEAFTSWLAKFKHYGGTEPLNENLEHDPIPGPCGGSSKVTYTVVDDCGIEKTCEATFTVLEKDDLEIITEAQPLTVSCESDPQTAFQQWLTNNGNAKATSTCDIVWSNNYSEELWDNTCENSKNITVTFTAFNGCEELETTAMFSIEDTTAPVLSDTPEDIIVACDNIPEAVILTAIDNCDDTVSVEFEEKSTTDGCKSTLERIWTATDCAGNSTSHTQIITIEDKQEPSFVEMLPIDQVVSCDNIPDPIILTALDNCDDTVSVEFEEKITTDGCKSTLERIWTATDCAGNSTTHTQIITIEDKQEPSFVETLPIDQVVSCDNIPDPVILTAIDNCDDTVSVEFEEKITTDGCKSTLERIWTATDCAGNTTNHTQIITIEDKQAPSFVETLPIDQVVSCDNIPEATILTAIDNCDDTVSVEFEEKTTTDGCSSTLERIWTATDCAGNITNHTQIITIEDKQAPVLAATSIGYLENISVSCGEIPEPPILAFEDNCTLDLSIHYSEIDSAMDPDGGYQITRLWKVSDQCNNTAQFTQLINIIPNGELKFNQQPEDLTVNCGSIPEPGIISATNGCEIDVPVTFTETLTGTQCSPIIERQWTATDSYGNSITHLQTIKIEDIQAPVFVEPLPEDQTLYCSILPEPITLTAVDQCDSNLVVEMEEITTTEGCKQITTRTWNVSDCAGNSTSHTQTIALIVDQEAPTLTTSSMELFKEEITISCANIPEAPQLEFQDHCSQEVTVIFEETSSYVNNQSDYEIQRVWEVTDPCDNQATFTQIIKVNQHNTQQDLVEIMLCQRDAVYDLNDLLPPGSNFGGTWTLATQDDYLSGNFFDPNSAELGAYTAYYTLEDSCTPQTIVTITVHDDCVVLPCDSSQSISISKAITPNGDQYNEYFTVSGLEDCGFKLELQIFNRWGHKIFESMDYQNNWNAFSNTSNSQFMPAGTYYYILTVVDSGYDPIKGYVYVGTTAK